MIANHFIRYEVPKEGANDSHPLPPTALADLYQQVEKDSRTTARISRRVSKRLKKLPSPPAHT